jgi:hypothetical protein
VRRDDAAHRLVLHVLELRQQHRLRLIVHPRLRFEGPRMTGPFSFHEPHTSLANATSYPFG